MRTRNVGKKKKKKNPLITGNGRVSSGDVSTILCWNMMAKQE